MLVVEDNSVEVDRSVVVSGCLKTGLTSVVVVGTGFALVVVGDGGKVIVVVEVD